MIKSFVSWSQGGHVVWDSLSSGILWQLILWGSTSHNHGWKGGVCEALMKSQLTLPLFRGIENKPHAEFTKSKYKVHTGFQGMGLAL